MRGNGSDLDELRELTRFILVKRREDMKADPELDRARIGSAEKYGLDRIA